MRKIIICCFILSSNLFFCQEKIEQNSKLESSKKTKGKSIEDKKNELKVQDALGKLLKKNNPTTSNGIVNSNESSVSKEIGSGTGSGNGGENSYGKGAHNENGTGLGYSLLGRKPIIAPKPENSCGNEYGTIVVKITVDKNGNTIDAISGFRGTTNSNTCLMNEAKKAALKTKWELSPNETERQIGTIIYKFKIKD